MIQKAYNDTEFTLQLTQKLSKRQVTNLSGNDQEQTTPDTDMTTEEMTGAQTEGTAEEKKGDLTRTQDQRTEMDETKHRQMNS